MNRQDYTRQHWFTGRKSRHYGNLLYELIPNFSWWKTFGQNTVDRVIHYPGNGRLNEAGYYIGWDKTHRCDRCGAKLVYRGSHSVRMAYACKRHAWMKRCGLCSMCDAHLEREKKRDMNTVMKSLPKAYVFMRPRQPVDIYRRKYIWL